jgi:hypothetical protein
MTKKKRSSENKDGGHPWTMQESRRNSKGSYI